MGDRGRAARTWVVDTGFDTLDATARNAPAPAHRRGGARHWSASTPRRSTDVVLTHLHYDHVGGLDQFPDARFHVQDREMAFATGRHMTEPAQRPRVHGRSRRRAGARSCTPTGSCSTTATTSSPRRCRCTTSAATPTACRSCGSRHAAGWLVLASDATHYYENMESGRPFPIVFDVDAMVDGWRTLRRSPSRPDVDRARSRSARASSATRPPGAGLEGIAVRLDLGPLKRPALE